MITEYVYAYLNDENVCISINWTTDEVNSPNMIRIEDGQPYSYLSKIYEDGKWKENPNPPIIPEPEDVISINDLLDLLVGVK